MNKHFRAENSYRTVCLFHLEDIIETGLPSACCWNMATILKDGNFPELQINAPNVTRAWQWRPLGHQSIWGQGPRGLSSIFRVTEAKDGVRGIHSDSLLTNSQHKMKMLRLASDLPNSFTTCSSLRIADFVHNCELRCRLAHTFMLCSLPVLLLTAAREWDQQLYQKLAPSASQLLQHQRKARKIRTFLKEIL